MKANKLLIQQIHIAKSKLKLDEDTYRSLIYQFSDGRETSSKELEQNEAQLLYNYLKDLHGDQQDKANRMRRKLISYAHQMHWYKQGTREIDYERIDNWCNKYGMFHKKLNDHNTTELAKLITQFEGMFVKYLKA